MFLAFQRSVFCLMSGLSFEKPGLDLAGLVFRNFYLIRGRNRRNLLQTHQYLGS